jgi:hypothetical protein
MHCVATLEGLKQSGEPLRVRCGVAVALLAVIGGIG